MASSALDIIVGAFYNINSVSPGEPLSSQDSTVGLNLLNDLLDSLSQDQAFVYTQQENIYTWLPGQYTYTVGNYIGGTFTGTVTSGSAVITGVTPPVGLIAGGTLTDTAAALPAGTVITQVGANTITMSNQASSTPVGLDTMTYTIPGNIPIARPLRFRNGFTRATSSGNANIDYGFEFTSLDRYKEELLKNVQGPWPYIAAYQPTFPLGTLYVYPAPGAAYTAHLFSDLVLSEFASITTAYSLPQGYTRALKKLLALELAPVYGKNTSQELKLQAKDAMDLIRGLNDQPVVTLRYDSAISRSQTNDASWAQHGGFV